MSNPIEGAGDPNWTPERPTNSDTSQINWVSARVIRPVRQQLYIRVQEIAFRSLPSTPNPGSPPIEDELAGLSEEMFTGGAESHQFVNIIQEENASPMESGGGEAGSPTSMRSHEEMRRTPLPPLPEGASPTTSSDGASPSSMSEGTISPEGGGSGAESPARPRRRRSRFSPLSIARRVSVAAITAFRRKSPAMPSMSPQSLELPQFMGPEAKFFDELYKDLQTMLSAYLPSPPELQEITDAREITLEQLEAPIMVGKDADKRLFVTICYQRSDDGSVGYDVFYDDVYRGISRGFVNLYQQDGELFCLTEFGYMDRAVQEEGENNYPDKATLDEAQDSGFLADRLYRLATGDAVPVLSEDMADLKKHRISAESRSLFDDFKHPCGTEGAPTIQLYDPKKQKPYSP